MLSLRHLVGTALLALPVAVPLACRAPAQTDAALDARAPDLFAADRAFARDTAARGLDGWLAWLTEDAARVPLGGSEVPRGKAAIAASDGPSFAPGSPELRWDPTAAGLFADGVTGYTTGRYEVVTAAGEVVARGAYVSLWRREHGEWRVFLDTGASDATPVDTTH